MRKLNRKGELSIESAPAIIVTIGLVFLIMATIALVSQKYGESLVDTTAIVHNETFTTMSNTTANQVANVIQCGFTDFAISYASNATGGEQITSGNYTTASNGYISVVADGDGYALEPWNITYSYKYGGIACNITSDLNAEIETNTSIAGIVLTISLVGIVLSVLIGVFVLTRGRRI